METHRIPTGNPPETLRVSGISVNRNRNGLKYGNPQEPSGGPLRVSGISVNWNRNGLKKRRLARILTKCNHRSYEMQMDWKAEVPPTSV